MKIGADRNKLLMLGGLALVCGYVIWSNFSPASAPASAPLTHNAAPVAGVASSATRVSTRRTGGQNRVTEWKPPGVITGATFDPQKVDPTLRLDLLAKVQQVEVNGSQRNLFQFGEAVRPVDKTPLPPVKKIAIMQGPAPPPAPPGPPPKPVAPPILLKYYGFSTPRSTNRKKAFFLDGEDIILASEGEMIKKRYLLVKIGTNSVTMEDTQFNTQQTLPLADEAAG